MVVQNLLSLFILQVDGKSTVLVYQILDYSCVLSLMELSTCQSVTRTAVRTPQTQSLGLFCLAWNKHSLD